MLVAILSDVHGNLEALAAALADAARRGAGAFVVAGDLVGDGPDPAGVVALVRRKGFPTVRGNVDDKVTEAAALPRNDQAALLAKRKKADLVRTARALGRGDLEWLRKLPESLSLEYERRRILVVHGSPLGNTDYVFPSITPQALAAKLGADRPDVLACGHSHIPFARRIGGVTVVNAGSVGRPVDGDPRGSYAVIELRKRHPVRARVVRFPFPAPDPAAGAGARYQ